MICFFQSDNQKVIAVDSKSPLSEETISKLSWLFGNAAMIEKVAGKLIEGENALIILAEENDEADLDGRLSKYDAEIARFDAAVIAADYTVQCIENTIPDDSHWYGVKFETALPQLIASLNP